MRVSVSVSVSVSVAVLLGAVGAVGAAGGSASDKPVGVWLNEAKQHTEQHRYADALAAYDGAIAKDPSSYTTFYKRALLYINLGKSSSAIADLSSVLELKPAFDGALLQRAKLYAKDCSLDSATADISSYLSRKPNDKDALELKSEIDFVKPLVKLDSCDSEVLSRVVNLCSMDVGLRLKRAKCEEEKGDFELAVSDLKRASRLKPDSTEIHLHISKLYLNLGELSESTTSLKECLKQDPEHKLCKSQFKKSRKLEKSFTKLDEHLTSNKFASALKILGLSGGPGLIEDVGDHAKLKARAFEAACKTLGELQKKDALEWCNKLLTLDPDNIDGLYYRAEAHILLEQYDDAIRDFQRAHELDQSSQKIVQGFHRAQRLQKQSQRRDYYKILGVSRDATKQQIKKKYRKMAQEWHPDKYTGDLDKETVVKKMSEINEAYGVLADDELRQRFDNGDDPNDQSQGGFPGGGQPFFFQDGFPGGGGFPFGHGGGRGQQFHFKFN